MTDKHFLATRASLCRAFADPTRIRILSLLLRRRGLCLCNVIEFLGLSRPEVSRQLVYLQRAGLIAVERQRGCKQCRLGQAVTQFHSKLIECLACFDDLPVFQEDRNKLATWNWNECECIQQTLRKRRQSQHTEATDCVEQISPRQ